MDGQRKDREKILIKLKRYISRSVLVLLVVIISSILIVAAFLSFLIAKLFWNSPELNLFYTPNHIGNFTHLNCQYLLESTIKTGMYKSIPEKISVTAEMFNTTSTTLHPGMQQATITRISNEEIEANLVVGTSQRYAIQFEDAENIIAQKFSSSIAISKTTGLAAVNTLYPSLSTRTFFYGCK